MYACVRIFVYEYSFMYNYVCIVVCYALKGNPIPTLVTTDVSFGFLLQLIRFFT